MKGVVAHSRIEQPAEAQQPSQHDQPVLGFGLLGLQNRSGYQVAALIHQKIVRLEHLRDE